LTDEDKIGIIIALLQAEALNLAFIRNIENATD